MSDKEQSSSPSAASSSSKDGGSMSRLQRNVAEKQRRDKLNGFINDLANEVPTIALAQKRVDKTGILRLSANHIRIYNSILNGRNKQKRWIDWCPKNLTGDQIQSIFESVDGFSLVTTINWKILLVQPTIEHHLGHQNIDVLGHSLFYILHPDDTDRVKDRLEELRLAFIQNGSRSERCEFQCRLREKSQPRSEVVTYRHVHFRGSIICEEDCTDNNGTRVVNHLFNAFVKTVDMNPHNDWLLEEAMADEYVTRHSLDGTIIFADFRLSLITGHMPKEVINFSAYKYIHESDIAIAQFAQRLMFNSSDRRGVIVYRLRTCDDRFVYLRSAGVLQFDSNGAIDHFVCINHYLSETEGERQLKYFVDQFRPHIKKEDFFPVIQDSTAAEETNGHSPSILHKTELSRDYKPEMSEALSGDLCPNPNNGASIGILLENGPRLVGGGVPANVFSIANTQYFLSRTPSGALFVTPTTDSFQNGVQQAWILGSDNGGGPIKLERVSNSPENAQCEEDVSGTLIAQPAINGTVVYSICSQSSPMGSDDAVRSSPFDLSSVTVDSNTNSPLNPGVDSHDESLHLQKTLWPSNVDMIEGSGSSMDCAEDGMYVNDKMDCPLMFHEDISSMLLSSELPQNDEEASLPSSNGWTQILNSTEDSMPFGNDIIDKDEENS